MALSNPYKLPRGNNSSLLDLHCQIGPEDWVYFKQLFPARNGVQDKILSTLFKKLIDELRRRNVDPHTHVGWHVDDPIYTLLDTILDGFQFVEGRTPRDNSGNPAA